jgi:hypothetical protein
MSRSRLFAIDNVVYASYESERDFNNPEGFQEIAGREFYRIIEDYNNKIKSKTSNN